MPTRTPVFKSAFVSAESEFDGTGVRPVVFDILAPDLATSLLPPEVRMVLHVNPSSMAMSYAKQTERIQTKGGFVEQHWGEAARSISFNMATGGFKRLYTGLSNITGGGYDTEGTRRETIAYDKFLDLLALFHNNGSIYDTTGQIAFQGIIKISFDGGIYLGWFASFNITESSDKPYQFDLTAEFTVAHEVMRVRTNLAPASAMGNFDMPAANVVEGWQDIGRAADEAEQAHLKSKAGAAIIQVPDEATLGNYKELANAWTGIGGD
jgi:hypothetical protein